MRIKLAALFVGTLLASTAQAEFGIGDVTNVLKQANQILGGRSAPSRNTTNAYFIEPGTTVHLPTEGRSTLYGNDCNNSFGANKACSYIKVDGIPRRVTVIPEGSNKAIDEVWKFKIVSSSQIIAIRPNGDVVQLSQ